MAAQGEQLAAAMQQAMGAFARASELLARSSLDEPLPPIERLACASILSSGGGAKGSAGRGRSASVHRPSRRLGPPPRNAHSALPSRANGTPKRLPRARPPPREPGAPPVEWADLTDRGQGELPSLSALASMPVLELVDKEREATARRRAELAPPAKPKPIFRGTPAPPRPPPLRSVSSAAVPAPVGARAPRESEGEDGGADSMQSPLSGSAASLGGSGARGGEGHGGGADGGDTSGGLGSVLGGLTLGSGSGSGLSPVRARGSVFGSYAHSGDGSPTRAAAIAAQRVAEARAAARAREEKARETAEQERAERALKDAQRVEKFRAEQARRLAAAERARRDAAAVAAAQAEAEAAERARAQAEAAERSEREAQESALRVARRLAEERQRASEARRLELDAAEAAARESVERGAALQRGARDRVARREAEERSRREAEAERANAEARYKAELGAYHARIAEDARQLARERLLRRQAGLPPPSPPPKPPKPPTPPALLRLQPAHVQPQPAAAGGGGSGALRAEHSACTSGGAGRAVAGRAREPAAPGAQQAGALANTRANCGGSGVGGGGSGVGGGSLRGEAYAHAGGEGARYEDDGLVSAVVYEGGCYDGFGSSAVGTGGERASGYAPSTVHAGACSHNTQGGGHAGLHPAGHGAGLCASEVGGRAGSGGGYASLFAQPGGVRVAVRHVSGGHAEDSISPQPAAGQERRAPAHGRRQGESGSTAAAAMATSAASRRLDGRGRGGGAREQAQAQALAPRGRQVAGLGGEDRLLVEEEEEGPSARSARPDASGLASNSRFDYNDDSGYAEGDVGGYGGLGDAGRNRHSQRDDDGSSNEGDDLPPRVDEEDELTAALRFAADAAAADDGPARVSGDGEWERQGPGGKMGAGVHGGGGGGYARIGVMRTVQVRASAEGADAHKPKAAHKKPVWKREPVPLTLMAEAVRAPPTSATSQGGAARNIKNL